MKAAALRPPLLAALLLAPLLSGCRFNFVPLIPPPVQVSLPIRITQADLKREGDALVLAVTLDGRLEPGYLTAHWFDGAKELGTDSVYLDAQTRSAALRLPVTGKGAYRAVLSFGGTVLRQVELYEVSP